MKKYQSNDQSKTCGEVISSDCVSWAGGAVDGLCQGATVTQVVQKVMTDSAGCCEGDFPPGHRSCYTGSWIPFSSTIPLTGIGVGFTWTVNSLGNPEYKWTRDGDLSVRGTMDITITPTILNVIGFFPMLSLSTTCFPTGWTANQSILNNVSFSESNGAIVAGMSSGLILEYPSGVLSFIFNLANVALVPVRLSSIDFGCTRFNIA